MKVAKTTGVREGKKDLPHQLPKLISQDGCWIYPPPCLPLPPFPLLLLPLSPPFLTEYTICLIKKK